MSYATTWHHLNKNNTILNSFEGRACFSPIASHSNFTAGTQFLLYDFSNMRVTQQQAQQYFLFLKAIPEFKELMPRSCTIMAKNKKFKIDLTKFNGTKVFTILTLIRAVVEDPAIVKKVLSYDKKKKYNVSLFDILKICGSIETTNNNHWITINVDKRNIGKMFNTRKHWDSPIPCIKTGLGRNLFTTFSNQGDGYAVQIPVSYNDIKLLKE